MRWGLYIGPLADIVRPMKLKSDKWLLIEKMKLTPEKRHNQNWDKKIIKNFKEFFNIEIRHQMSMSTIQDLRVWNFNAIELNKEVIYIDNFEITSIEDIEYIRTVFNIRESFYEVMEHYGGIIYKVWFSEIIERFLLPQGILYSSEPCLTKTPFFRDRFHEPTEHDFIEVPRTYISPGNPVTPVIYKYMRK